MGHPARILDPTLQELSLDALIHHSGAAHLIRDVRSDLERIQVSLNLTFIHFCLRRLFFNASLVGENAEIIRRKQKSFVSGEEKFDERIEKTRKKGNP